MKHSASLKKRKRKPPQGLGLSKVAKRKGGEAVPQEIPGVDVDNRKTDRKRELHRGENTQKVLKGNTGKKVKTDQKIRSS